jgi:hypothetical protein
MRSNQETSEKEIRQPSSELEARIASYLGKLKDDVSSNLREVSFESLVDAAKEWLVTEGGKDEISSTQEYVDYLMQQSDESHYYPIRCALRHLLRAQNANAQGQRELAWSELVDGAYWVACATNELHQRREAEQFNWREVAKKGGKQKGVKAQALYQWVGAVIDELAPTDGWVNRRIAIQAVHGDVFERLNKEFGYEINPEKRITRLNQWYRDHDVVQAAFDRHLRAR